MFMVLKALHCIKGTFGHSIKAPESAISACFSYILFSGKTVCCLPPENPDKERNLLLTCY